MNPLTPIFATAVVFCVDGTVEHGPLTRTCYVPGSFNPGIDPKRALDLVRKISYDGELGLPAWQNDLTPSTTEQEELFIVRSFPVLKCGNAIYVLTQFCTDSHGILV